MVVDVDPQVLFDLLVDPFSLSISLWVIGRQKVPFNVQQSVQVLHEVRVELGTPVMDDLLGDAMELKYMVTIQPGHAL